jgi:hypothetical protein
MTNIKLKQKCLEKNVSSCHRAHYRPERAPDLAQTRRLRSERPATDLSFVMYILNF